MDLCRLCLKRCGAIGIVVYPNDIRREKIHQCLSIVVSTIKLLDFSILISNVYIFRLMMKELHL